MPLEVFTRRNFATAFFRQKLKWNILEKNSKIAFCATLWGNVHGSSMARWKARGRLPISANWTFFASSYGWGAMSKYRSILRCLKGGLVTLSANFRKKWSSTNEFWRQKIRVPLAITWCCLRDPACSRFDTIPACDTQTHTQTDRHAIVAITRAELAPRG